MMDREKPKNKIEEHLDELFCNHWAVVTTIFEPSEAVMKQAKVDDWDLRLQLSARRLRKRMLDHLHSHLKNPITQLMDEALIDEVDTATQL